MFICVQVFVRVFVLCARDCLFFDRCKCPILSNALRMSRKTRVALHFFNFADIKIDLRSDVLMIVPGEEVNPLWCGLKFTYVLRRLSKARSITLRTTEQMVIGLKFLRSLSSPDLWMRTVLAVRKHGGTCPVCNILVAIVEIISVTMSSFTTLIRTWSGPGAVSTAIRETHKSISDFVIMALKVSSNSILSASVRSEGYSNRVQLLGCEK